MNWDVIVHDAQTNYLAWVMVVVAVFMHWWSFKHTGE